MRLSFVSDTYPLNRVSDLCNELCNMVVSITSQNITFPFDIGIAIRCLPDKLERKSFKRFNTKDNRLTIDITVSQDLYKSLSLNEQREQLGITFYNYFEESLLKSNKASKNEIKILIGLVKGWLEENNWLNGNIFVARKLISDDIALYEVSKKTSLTLNEVEELYCKMNGFISTYIHRDNEKH